MCVNSRPASGDIAREIADSIADHCAPVRNPRVLVLVGLQYAGKSFLAERIAADNIAHIWATKIKQKYGLSNDEMTAVAVLLIERLAGGGINVMLDGVNHKRQVREAFRRASDGCGARYQTIYLDIPRSERLRRRDLNIENGELPGRRIISLEQMDLFEAEFEPPDLRENALHLRSSEDVRLLLESWDIS